MRWEAIWGAFHFLGLNLKNLSTVGNGSLLCISQKTTDFWRIIVETMNLTLHAQTERVNWDNWQIPWRNEMLRTLKVTSVFAFCLAKEPQHFDVLPHPGRETHSFCQVNSFPIFQATIVTSGNWFDPWRVDISFGDINQNVPAKRGREMCQMKLLKSKVLWEWCLEYLSGKWDISERHTKTQEN